MGIQISNVVNAIVYAANRHRDLLLARSSSSIR